jgi:hypothetical protein
VDDAARLSKLWDERVEGAEVTERSDLELLAEISWLETITQTPAPPDGLAERTWNELTGTPLPLAIYQPGAQPAPNGRHAAATTPRQARAISGRWIVVGEAIRLLAVATIGGFAGGFLSGIWARIAMRLAGALTIDRNRGLLTDNDAVVGHITLGGTMSIAMFGGVLGVIAGLLYVALRRWLPGSDRVRPLSYGVLLLGVFGFVIMDKSNPDYNLFGPAWMNVGSFSLAYLVMGYAIGSLVDWLDRRMTNPIAATRSNRANALRLVAMAPFASLGFVGLVMTAVGTAGIGAVVMLLIALSWIPVVRPGFRLRLPVLVRNPVTFAYATLALPCLIGLGLTLRAIVVIVGG